MTPAEAVERAEALEQALVELRRLTSAVGPLMSERDALRAQLAQVTAERDEAHARLSDTHESRDGWRKHAIRIEAERDRLREALASVLAVPVNWGTDELLAARAALEATPPADTVAVPLELLERICMPDKLAFRAIDELRELLGAK